MRMAAPRVVPAPGQSNDATTRRSRSGDAGSRPGPSLRLAVVVTAHQHDGEHRDAASAVSPVSGENSIRHEPGRWHFEAALRLRGALDVDALERALREIVRRHRLEELKGLLGRVELDVDVARSRRYTRRLARVESARPSPLRRDAAVPPTPAAVA